ncbi:hypothetical protein [Aeromonas sobria]|uniref:hypothetical protein n=1 Tax=Aeromonas sobria TaxID=646 RepID=UPI003CFF9D99
MQTQRIDYEQINLAGLTPMQQAVMNTAGFLNLREMFGKYRSSLDTDWLALSSTKKAAICAIARQSRNELVTATLSSLPYARREAIRLAVIALDYQSAFRGGCDRREWHPAPRTRSIGDIEREKKERTAKLQQKRAIAAGIEMSRQGPRPIGQ